MIFCKRWEGMKVYSGAPESGSRVVLARAGLPDQFGICSGLGPGFRFSRDFAGFGDWSFGYHSGFRRWQQIALERLRDQLFKLFHAGKFAHIIQAEAQQEFLGGLVKNGSSDDGLTA